MVEETILALADKPATSKIWPGSLGFEKFSMANTDPTLQSIQPPLSDPLSDLTTITNNNPIPLAFNSESKIHGQATYQGGSKLFTIADQSFHHPRPRGDSKQQFPDSVLPGDIDFMNSESLESSNSTSTRWDSQILDDFMANFESYED